METTNNTNTVTNNTINTSGNVGATLQNPSQKLEVVGNKAEDELKMFSGVIECSIRRKQTTMGLPGQDPAERIYRVGASLDIRTKGNLKGITGDLEKKYMPEVLGVGYNDPAFRREVEVYWSSISLTVPHDEEHLKEHERGAVLKVPFTVTGKSRLTKLDKCTSVAEKMEVLNMFLLPQGDKPAVAFLDYDAIPSYLMLNYCLKYETKVAKRFADVELSPKIDFYIFEKAVAVKNQLSLIELRSKAMTSYQTLAGNTRLIDAIILAFEKNPNEYDTETDKLLVVDELYNKNPTTMQTFVNMVADENWEVKYLVNRSLNENRLRRNSGSTAIYHRDTLVGLTLEDAVSFLVANEKGKEIKQELERELN